MGNVLGTQNTQGTQADCSRSGGDPAWEGNVAHPEHSQSTVAGLWV